MKTLFIFAIAVLLSQQIPAHAQITITEADLRAILGEKSTFTLFTALNTEGLASVVASTGDNKTFDFSMLPYDSGEDFTTELVTCTSELPGCLDPHFQDANYIGAQIFPGPAMDLDPDSVFLSFAQLDADGLLILGGAGRAEVDDTNPGLEEFTLKFTPALLQMKLPLTMSTTWSSNTSLDTDEGTLFIIEESSVVEGWGQLVTPDGEQDVLKVRTRQITSFSFGGIELADTSFTITFYSKSGATADIDLSNAGEVLGASYSIQKPPPVGTDRAAKPYAFRLDAVYPNPFNPSTSIPFTLETSGHAQLVVFDILGKEVARLVDELRPAGNYVARWVASVPNGSYLVRLSVDDNHVYRTVTLVK